MSFVGIDIGTSFIKGAVLDAHALRMSHVRRVPFPDPLPGLPPLYREFDPRAVLSAVQRLLADLLAHAAGCEGIVVCSQMHNLVLVSARGEPRSNLTTWQDQRVLLPHPSGQGTYLDVLRQRLSPEQVRQLGNELRPGQPLGVLFWLAEQGQLPGGDAIPASLPDFVLANLCGSVPSTETTNAAAHGALNLETLDWHYDVLALLGLGGLRWPALRAHGEVVGRLPVGSHKIPCYTPVGDYQCALMGTLLEPGELSLNISTGSQVSLLQRGAAFGSYQTRPFFDGRFLATITHIPAGRALNALVGLLTELAGTQERPDLWPYIARQAAEVGETEMRVNLAFFDSACGDRGGITQIREAELTVGHLFRAAFQNMADNYYACALQLSPEQGWRNLVFSGGLAQIAILRQLICERFGGGQAAQAYRLCPTTEDTLLGLLGLALAFTGRAASVEQAVALLREAHRSRDTGTASRASSLRRG
jgi:sugar (pentulose or hexulose) kinase